MVTTTDLSLYKQALYEADRLGVLPDIESFKTFLGFETQAFIPEGFCFHAYLHPLVSEDVDQETGLPMTGHLRKHLAQYLQKEDVVSNMRAYSGCMAFLKMPTVFTPEQGIQEIQKYARKSKTQWRCGGLHHALGLIKKKFSSCPVPIPSSFVVLEEHEGLYLFWNRSGELEELSLDADDGPEIPPDTLILMVGEGEARPPDW